MNNQELLRSITEITSGIQQINQIGKLAEALELLRLFSGEQSSFYKGLLEDTKNVSSDSYPCYIDEYLSAFKRFIENGLLKSISPKRQAQIDVVSDLLSQAEMLLNQNDIHPAAPTVLIGASLEEFLRNWVEATPGLSIGDQRPGIEAFSNALRKSEAIDKQDCKDITSWSGMRNDAAHGNWEKVEDRQKISLMLQGVNLFMRKYSN